MNLRFFSGGTVRFRRSLYSPLLNILHHRSYLGMPNLETRCIDLNLKYSAMNPAMARIKS